MIFFCANSVSESSDGRRKSPRESLEQLIDINRKTGNERKKDKRKTHKQPNKCIIQNTFIDISPSFCLCIYLSTYLSICPSIELSVCLFNDLLLAGIPDNKLNKLQRIQNRAAPLVLSMSRHVNVTALLRTLH